MSALAEQLGAGVLLLCAALPLAVTSFRRRMPLALFCLISAAALVLAALLDVFGDRSVLLAGSFIASAIGAVLLGLGLAMQRPVGRRACGRCLSVQREPRRDGTG